jgi:hypothetical protein
MTNKDSIINHVEKASGFNHDGTDGDMLTFSTRENGNVGDEEPGEADIKMAHQIAGDIRHQYDVKNIEVSSVDEWVYLEFEVV